MFYKRIFVSAVILLVFGYVAFRILEEERNELPCEKACVRFCCEVDKDQECNYNITYMKEAKELNNNYKPIHGVECNNVNFDTRKWKFLENGHIKTEELSNKLSWREYCIVYNSSYKNHTFKKCDFHAARHKIYYDIANFMYISMPFFLITIIIYACIPELRNLHGKCFLCFVSGLMMRLLSKIIIHKNNHCASEHLTTFKIAGYFYIFTSWIAFLWLNVIGIDVLLAFNPNYHKNQTKTFLYYCLYAFGTSTVVVLLIIILNELELIPSDYQQTIGVSSCIRGTEIINYIIYTLAPIIYTFVFNFVLFLITASKIHTLKKCESKRQSSFHDSAKFRVYLRLMGLMGLIWIFDVLNASNFYVTTLGLNIFNHLQGFFIFIIFVWTNRVMDLIRKRFY